MYSVICDGTHDVSGKEQTCICLRYVDEKLSPVELFVGLYDADNEWPQERCTRFSKRTTATYTIYSLWSTYCESCAPGFLWYVIRNKKNSLQLAHDIGFLFSQSLNARRELKNNGIGFWCPIEKNSHAHGLLQKLESSYTVLGLLMTKHIIGKLEILNKALHGPQQTLTGMAEAVSLIKDSITTLRSEEEFHYIVVETGSFTKEHDLKDLQVPRQRKPSKRFSGPSDVFQARTVDEYYHKEFYAVIDTAINWLYSRFNNDNIKKMQILEKGLLEGEISDDIACYSEVATQLLKSEVELFLSRYKPKFINHICCILLESPVEVRNLFQS
ncbi:hypothetical protein PR048_015556 [Dryococelus australis]|uniref:DUF3800 domain-containing protein n=1 Tax=Dryococelus australis TaxID=614101 RepID=A0ABQ9HHH9_9NEOP|nr:hypothetical protein PR048_015556 [Dryococelus australis]